MKYETKLALLTITIMLLSAYGLDTNFFFISALTHGLSWIMMVAVIAINCTEEDINVKK